MNTNESIQIILYPDLREKVNELAFKYEKLVWYGRSGCGLDQHPPELKEKVLNARSKYEEKYPEDIARYNSSNGDFYHGFNSGCLAAFRLVQIAMDEEYYILDDDDETKIPVDPEQRLEWALEEFPQLDT
mgnify:CR=1 FL=1